MKKLLFVLMISPVLLIAQQLEPELKFVEETHDFGLIKESDGPAEYKFEFTNTSQAPITITNVRASCGCTTPAWTREPVLPGKSGFITAVYNPKNRPGPFNKTLTVTTNGQKNTIILRIQGKVEPKPRTIEDDFPTVIGDLRAKYRAFNMGKVYDNKPAVKTFEVYNQGEGELTFLSEVDAPEHIKVTFEPQTIGARQKGRVMVKFDSKSQNELGFTATQISFYTDEQEPQNKKTFTVYADLNEYFAPLTPETAAMAPKLNVEKRVHDFGKITQGDVVAATYKLINDGKSPLNIRKVSSNCTCAVTEIGKMDLQPGESVELQLSFNSTGRRGTQQKSITIYSNDPVTPVQRVIMKASVQLPNN